MLRMTSDLRLDQCQEPGNSIGIVGLGEDMRPVDVMTACTIDECARGLGELVKFQAPLWNSRTMPELQRLADPRRTIGVLDAAPVGLQPFIARFGDQLDPSPVKLFESVVPRAGE